MIKRTRYFFFIAGVSPDSLHRQSDLPKKGFQIPNIKFQIPNKSQFPISNVQNDFFLDFEFSSLELRRK